MKPLKSCASLGLRGVLSGRDHRRRRPTIVEDGNLVRLTPAEWNDPVARIQRGELREA